MQIYGNAQPCAKDPRTQENVRPHPLPTGLCDDYTHSPGVPFNTKSIEFSVNLCDINDESHGLSRRRFHRERRISVALERICRA